MEEAAKVHDNGKRGERVGAREGAREGGRGGEGGAKFPAGTSGTRASMDNILLRKHFNQSF